MKLVRTFSMFIALASASTVYAQGAAKSPAKPTEKAPAAAPTKDAGEVSAAEAEQVLAFFNKFADAVMANKDNCPKMATGINGVIDSNAAFIKKANEMKNSGKKLPKATEEKMGARLKEMVPVMMTCKDDKAVAAALQRMDNPDAKAAPTTAPAKTDTKAPAKK